MRMKTTKSCPQRPRDWLMQFVNLKYISNSYPLCMNQEQVDHRKKFKPIFSYLKMENAKAVTVKFIVLFDEESSDIL